MNQVSHVTVRADEDGWRFDRWAKSHYPTLAFGQLQKLCRTGQFRLDGRLIEANARLAPGQVVRVPPLGELPEPAPKAGPPILRTEDKAFIRSLVVHEDSPSRAAVAPLAMSTACSTPWRARASGPNSCTGWIATLRGSSSLPGPRLQRASCRSPSSSIACASSTGPCCSRARSVIRA